MNWSCLLGHRWVVTGQNHVIPEMDAHSRRLISLTPYPAKKQRHLVTGFTVVYLRCCRCGTVSEKEVTGKYEGAAELDQLERWFKQLK